MRKLLLVPLIIFTTLISCQSNDDSIPPTLEEETEIKYPEGTVFCNDVITEIKDVTNPVTGKTWMDRNLGASQVATSIDDAAAYGDLYQWGRGADGHQCRDSQNTSTFSNSDQPSHGDFILASTSESVDWRSPQNDNLWQGVDGVNNPCPNGYRLPTEAELIAERESWTSKDPAGAFASPLKFSLPGVRTFYLSESIMHVGTEGYYWSSSFRKGTGAGTGYNINSSYSSVLSIDSPRGHGVTYRASGHTVRCIKN